MTSPLISLKQDKVRVQCAEVEEFVPRNTPLELFLKHHFPDRFDSIIGAVVNGLLTPRNALLSHTSTIVPLEKSSNHGLRIYRSTLMFVLAIASHSLYPNKRLVVSHSVADALYYYYDDLTVTQEVVSQLFQLMRKIIEANVVISQDYCSSGTVLDLLKATQKEQIVALLEQLNTPYYRINRLETSKAVEKVDLSYVDLVYFDTCLAPSTGFCSLFDLSQYNDGLLLKFPDSSYTEVVPFFDNKQLFDIYQEYNQWGKILHVDSVSSLNQKILKGPKVVKEFVQICEHLHDIKISQISSKILERFGHSSQGLVLIAGPSSSGKTTFSKRLELFLRTMAMDCLTFSLDSFYVPRIETPRDEHGNYDFESVFALDLPLLKKTIQSLLDGETTVVPGFDFKSGCRIESSRIVTLGPGSVLILEGLHALNPILFEGLDLSSKTYKIFISPLCQLNVDDQNRISTSDTRLCRRMIRDFLFRGNSCERTFTMWPFVTRGEHKHIYVHQNQADVFFNSALDYEFSVLKTFVLPLLHSLPPSSQWYTEARRLISFLSVFFSIDTEYIPKTSILREFIGNSWFDYE
ncbi:hypothetical protein RCL1_002159 [Eukaryota sp. TZLM3-RCL]